jgi:DNA-binding response OmpR family regulator
MLPEVSGTEVCRTVRSNERTAATPIIMLTARADEAERVAGLEMGADDYLTKPFSPKILIARIRALLRRAEQDKDAALEVGELKLRVDDLALEGIGDAPVRLTPLEARLLQLLLANAGRTVVTDRILTHVWGNRAGGNRQLLKQLVHRLRQKIEGDPKVPRLLRTVPNAGYVLDPAQSAGNVESDDYEDG